MQINHLEFLTAISKTGSISAASQELFISPQGISSAITRLENELGISLLNRKRQGATLTPAGKTLAEAGEAFAAVIQRLKEESCLEAAQTNTNISGKVSLCYAPIFQETLLPHFLTELCSKYPKLNVSATELGAKELVPCILNGEYDFGFAVQLFQNDRPIYTHNDFDRKALKAELGIKRIDSEPVIVIASKDHSIAQKSFVSIPEVLTYPLICSSKNALTRVVLDALEINSDSQIRAFSDSSYASYALVSQNIGIMLSTRLGSQSCLKRYPNVVQIPIKENMTCSYCIMTNRRKKMDAAANLCMSMLQTMFNSSGLSLSKESEE